MTRIPSFIVLSILFRRQPFLFFSSRRSRRWERGRRPRRKLLFGFRRLPPAANASICPECGSKVNDGQKFCPECGHKNESYGKWKAEAEAAEAARRAAREAEQAEREARKSAQAAPAEVYETTAEPVSSEETDAAAESAETEDTAQ